MLELLAAAAVGGCFNLIFGTGAVALKADQIICGLALVFIGIGLSWRVGKVIRRRRGRDHQYVARTWPVEESRCRSDPVPSGVARLYTSLFASRSSLTSCSTAPRPERARSATTPWPRTQPDPGRAVADVLRLCLRCARRSRRWIFEPGRDSPLGPPIDGRTGLDCLGYIVFVAGWRPIGLIFAALLFGGLRALNDVAQQFGWPIPSEFLAMLPYLGTFLVVVGRGVWYWRRRGRSVAPEALGIPFIRS